MFFRVDIELFFYDNSVMKKFIAMIAAAVLLFSCIPLSALAVSSKAPYLAFDLDLPLKSRDASADFVKDASAGICFASDSASGSAKNMLLHHDSSPDFISKANESGLVDAGMFPSKCSSKELFDFFTGTNEFQQFSINDCSICGGNRYALKSGDFIFWKDEKGGICSTGLVAGCTDYAANIVEFNSSGKAGIVRFSRASFRLPAYENAVVVSLVYPMYVSLLYLYLRTEFGYPHYGACAVLGNMYCESACDPRADERDEMYSGVGFGICQWSYTRRQELNDFCDENNLPLNSIYSQLAWLRKEIRNDYTELNGRLLKAFTEEDLYNCAYNWCLLYEQPFDKENESVERAQFCVEKFAPPQEAEIEN